MENNNLKTKSINDKDCVKENEKDKENDKKTFFPISSDLTNIIFYIVLLIVIILLCYYFYMCSSRMSNSELENTNLPIMFDNTQNTILPIVFDNTQNTNLPEITCKIDNTQNQL